MSMKDYTSQKIGNYILKKRLANGAFADVYLGEDVLSHQEVALKILPTQPSGLQQDFQKEARMIQGLAHQNIVRLLEYGSWMDISYLVMEYIPLGSLRDCYPKGTPLPLDLVVHYVKQVASALQAAHSQGIIHRDVKPQNLLLQDRGQILLSDFGIATLIGDAPGSLTRNAAGTPAYMAPEQLRGEKTFAIDQYALAVMAYEWLCGELPFPESSPHAQQFNHLNTPPPPLSERCSNIPSELGQVVMRALAKDPTMRFPTVMAFAEALEQASYRAGSVTVVNSSDRQVPTVLAASSVRNLTPISRQETLVSTRKQAPRDFLWRKVGISFLALLLLFASITVAFVAGSTHGAMQTAASLNGQVPGTITAIANHFQATMTALPKSPTDAFLVDVKRLTQSDPLIDPLLDATSHGWDWDHNPNMRAGACSFNVAYGFVVISRPGFSGNSCLNQSSRHPRNLAMRVHAQLLQGNSIGISVRWTGISPNYNFYLFQLARDGRVQLIKHMAPGASASPSCDPMTRRPVSIDTSDASPDYILGIVVVDTHIRMYVDGQLVCQAIDSDAYGAGQIGFSAGQGPSQVLFHKMEFWDLD